jgi:hypothetical protein
MEHRASLEVNMDRERLKQPVTAIRACAQFALLKLERATPGERGDIRPYLATIVAETRRLETLLKAPADEAATDVLLSMRPLREERTPVTRGARGSGDGVAPSNDQPADVARDEWHGRRVDGGLTPEVAQQLRLASFRLARGENAAHDSARDGAAFNTLIAVGAAGAPPILGHI